MPNIEEVKKILMEMKVYQKTFPKAERPIVRDELARKICQLFPDCEKCTREDWVMKHPLTYRP